MYKRIYKSYKTCFFLDNDLTLEKPTEQDSEVAFVLIPKVWWKPNIKLKGHGRKTQLR